MLYNASNAACEASKATQQAQCEATKQSLLILNARIAIDCRHATEVNDLTTELGVDRPDKGDYYNLSVSDLQICQQICRQDARCKAYTFLTPNSSPSDWHGPPPPHCWLKEAVPEPKPYAGFISGVRIAKFLWVDDHPDNNRHEREALTALGVTFTLAATTDEAIKLLKSNKYDVLITDFKRKDDQQAAYTLLHALKQVSSPPPVIIYSASATTAFEKAAKAEGAYGETNNPRRLVDLSMSAISEK